MHKLLWNLLFVAFFIALMSAGCGEHDHSGDPWSPTESPPPEQPGGEYSVELEILEDGCSPRLSELTTYTHWPPSHSPVMELSDSRNRRLGLILMNLRAGSLEFTDFPLDDGFHPADTLAYEESMSGFRDFRNVSCEVGTGTGSITELRIVPVARGKMTATFKTTWKDDIFECADSDARTLNPWLPESTCRESYRLTFSLVRQCLDNGLRYYSSGAFVGEEYGEGGGYSDENYRYVSYPGHFNRCSD